MAHESCGSYITRCKRMAQIHEPCCACFAWAMLRMLCVDGGSGWLSL